MHDNFITEVYTRLVVCIEMLGVSKVSVSTGVNTKKLALLKRPMTDRENQKHNIGLIHDYSYKQIKAIIACYDNIPEDSADVSSISW